jgi:hypothetical protein
MQLYEAVSEARISLRAVEDEYERGLEAGSAVLRITGREYASAVLKYSNAVMSWLKWFDRYGSVGGGQSLPLRDKPVGTAAVRPIQPLGNPKI